MPPAARIVVVGADAAGMSAAHQALRGARARPPRRQRRGARAHSAHLVLRLRDPLLDRRGRR